MRLLFVCHVQQRSDIGLVTNTCASATDKRGSSTQYVSDLPLVQSSRAATHLSWLYEREGVGGRRACSQEHVLGATCCDPPHTEE